MCLEAERLCGGGSSSRAGILGQGAQGGNWGDENPLISQGSLWTKLKGKSEQGRLDSRAQHRVGRMRMYLEERMKESQHVRWSYFS